MKTRTSIVILSLLLCSGSLIAQIYEPGCTDPLANNYDSLSTYNDGSCVYEEAFVTPVFSVEIAEVLDESSGLVLWNGVLWTHNDDTDRNLYTLDTLTGEILDSFFLPGTYNRDWEEITQDEQYFYIGDFGNNANGNRTDLNILRIDKYSLLAGAPLIDTIFFSYSNQHEIEATGGNNTDFDCEAFIAKGDSLYLFTKQWVSEQTTVYALPKTPGTYVADSLETFNVLGLITGSTYLPGENLVVLCGYSSFLQPFLYLLYDFNPTQGFFSGNKRKIALNLSFHQVEGIATGNGLRYYLTNEYISRYGITIKQKMHLVDLTDYLTPYLWMVSVDIINQQNTSLSLYPNPAYGSISVVLSESSLPTTYFIVDLHGKIHQTASITSANTLIAIDSLSPGFYLFQVEGKFLETVGFIKR